MPQLVKFGRSPIKGKRFMAVFENPKKTTHFGQTGAYTYIDGASDGARDAFRARHKESLKTKDPLRSGFLSYYVIWGKSRSAEKNLKRYLKRFDIKDSR